VIGCSGKDKIRVVLRTFYDGFKESVPATIHGFAVGNVVYSLCSLPCVGLFGVCCS
jgi:hypothetical protein